MRKRDQEQPLQLHHGPSAAWLACSMFVQGGTSFGCRINTEFGYISVSCCSRSSVVCFFYFLAGRGIFFRCGAAFDPARKRGGTLLITVTRTVFFTLYHCCCEPPNAVRMYSSSSALTTTTNLSLAHIPHAHKLLCSHPLEKFKFVASLFPTR